jgi:hypothetical protein
MFAPFVAARDSAKAKQSSADAQRQRERANEQPPTGLTASGFAPLSNGVYGRDFPAHEAVDPISCPSWSLTRVALSAPGRNPSPIQPLPTPLRLPIQAKLGIGAVDDPLEREADGIAEQVVRAPSAQIKVACGGRGAGSSEVKSEQGADILRRRPGVEHIHRSEVPATVHKVLTSPGQPLDSAARAFMEPRFGYDLSKVRIHSDALAANSARSIGAVAYTVGSQIVFGAGRLAPATTEGRALLAHELAHVLQQQQAPARVQRRPSADTEGPRDTILEIHWTEDADVFYRRILSSIRQSKPFSNTDRDTFESYHDREDVLRVYTDALHEQYSMKHLDRKPGQIVKFHFRANYDHGAVSGKRFTWIEDAPPTPAPLTASQQLAATPAAAKAAPAQTPADTKRHRHATELKATDARALIQTQLPVVAPLLNAAQYARLQHVLDAAVVNPVAQQHYKQAADKAIIYRNPEGGLTVRDRQKEARAGAVFDREAIAVDRGDDDFLIDYKGLITPDALRPTSDNPDEVSYLQHVQRLLDNVGIWLHIAPNWEKDGVSQRDFKAWLSLGPANQGKYNSMETMTGRMDRTALLSFMDIGAGYYEKVDQGPVLSELDRQISNLQSAIDDGLEQYFELRKVRRDAAVGVAFISDHLGGAHFPDETLWLEPHKLLLSAREFRIKPNTYATRAMLVAAGIVVRNAAMIISEYLDDTEKGASRAVKILKVAEKAGEVAQVVLTIADGAAVIKGAASLARGYREAAAADKVFVIVIGGGNSVDGAASSFISHFAAEHPTEAGELSHLSLRPPDPPVFTADTTAAKAARAVEHDTAAASSAANKSAGTVDGIAQPDVKVHLGDDVAKTRPVGSQSKTGYSRTAPTSDADVASAGGRTGRRAGPTDRGKGARPRYANDPVKPKVPGGTLSSSVDISERIRHLPEESQERLLTRVVRGDAKGRPFGTPRNPRLPTIEEFNPRVENVRAGDVEELVTGTKHGVNPEQAGTVGKLGNDDLVRFRIEDPISGTRTESGLSLTGGHHRTAQIIDRVKAGTLDPDTVVEILVHD